MQTDNSHPTANHACCSELCLDLCIVQFGFRWLWLAPVFGALWAIINNHFRIAWMRGNVRKAVVFDVWSTRYLDNERVQALLFFLGGVRHINNIDRNWSIFLFREVLLSECDWLAAYNHTYLATCRYMKIVIPYSLNHLLIFCNFQFVHSSEMWIAEL